jgi:hypothetical protein
MLLNVMLYLTGFATRNKNSTTFGRESAGRIEAGRREPGDVGTSFMSGGEADACPLPLQNANAIH